MSAALAPDRSATRNARPVAGGAGRAAVLGSLALGLAGLGGLLAPLAPWRPLGFLALAAGGVAFVLVGRHRPVAERWLPAPMAVGPPARPSSQALWLGLAAAVAVDAAGLSVWAGRGDPNLAWSLYLAALAMVLLATWLAVGRPLPRPRRPSAEVALVAGLLLLATAIRTYNLGGQPYGLWKDEAQIGMAVVGIIYEPTFRPVYGFDEPALHWYVTVPFVLAAGANPVGLRLSSAAGGVLSILGTYLLARELGGRRYAALAAALLSLAVWHVNFSRIAFVNSPWSLALDALATFWFLRAVRRGSVADGVLGGLCLGFGLQMYYFSRLVPLILALYGLHRLIAERMAVVRRAWRAVVAFGLVAAIGVSPLVMFAVLEPGEFFRRLGDAAVVQNPRTLADLEPLRVGLVRYLLMFQAVGDLNGRHNLPGAPMLDPLTGACLAVGLVYVLARPRRPGAFLLATWIPIMLIPGILSVEPPQTIRSLGVVTGVALLAALPLAALSERWRCVLAQYDSRRAALVTAAGLAIVLGTVGAINLDRYFNQMRRDPKVVALFSPADTFIGYQAGRLAPGTRVFVSDEGFRRFRTIQFLAPLIGDLESFDPAAQLPFEPGGDVAVYLTARETRTVAQLRQLYPGVEPRQLQAPYADDARFLELVIPSAALPGGAQRGGPSR